MSEYDNDAIMVESVSKSFVLPHEKKTSIKQAVVGLFQKHDRGFENQQALSNISFTIKKGEFFGILGRNGSGKSTLLKILAGIYQPSKGKVVVNGKLVPFIELGVGFNPELTGRENVYLNGALLGFSRFEIDEMYDDVVAFAELGRFMDQKLKNYSSGMQVRLAFSVATRAKAEVLLIDEVLAVGDADFQKKCFEYFRRLKSEDTTVVFVTHDMNAVREYCDRAVLIENSEIVEIGNANSIASMYTKMFIAQDDAMDGTEAARAERWGTKAVTLSNVAFDKKRYSDDDSTVSFGYDFVANQDLEDPVAGFLMKTSAQQHLMGTNSQILQQPIGAMRKGEKRTVRWTVPNIFNNGSLLLDPSVVYNGGSEVAEWWDDAASTDIFKEFKTPYIINPDVTVLIDGNKT